MDKISGATKGKTYVLIKMFENDKCHPQKVLRNEII